MKITLLDNKKFPNLSDNVKERIINGYWSLFLCEDNSLIIRTEKIFFKIDNNGNILERINIEDFKGIYKEKINFKQ